MKKKIFLVSLLFILSVLALFIFFKRPVVRALFKSKSHFINHIEDSRVFFEPGAEIFADKIAAFLPDAVDQVEKGHYQPLKKSFRVYVFSTQKSHNEYLAVPASLPIRGAAFTRKVYIAPSAFSFQGLDTHEESLMHEMSHLLIRQHVGFIKVRKIPFWYSEGLANIVAGSGGEGISEDLAIQAIRQGRQIPIIEKGGLLKSLSKIIGEAGLSGPMYHRQNKMFVGFLRDSNPDAFRNLLLEVLDGVSFSKSFENNYQASPQELWERFQFGAPLSGALLETDYPNKRLTWIVTYPPGGGYDTYSRAIAQVLPKYLPNEEDVLIKNVNGAGGRRGTAALYRSKPDGYTIGLLNPIGLIASDLVKEASEYDLDRFTFLATCSQSVACLFVRADSEYSSLESMRTAEHVRFATSGHGSGSWLWGIICREIFDIPVHLVSGYLGTNEYLTALIRKDVDAVGSPFSSQLYSYWESGEIKPLLLFVKEPWELMPQTPTLQGSPFEELELFNSDRVIAAPPGVEESIAQILKDSLAKALQDPELQAWAKKTRNPLLIRDAGETEIRIGEIKRLMDKYKSELIK